MKNESKEKQENIEREGKRELLKPKNDVVFQSLFNQKNETITKNMISALLGEEIIKIKINETKELYREYPEEKRKGRAERKSGRKEEKIEIAKELLKIGVPIDKIVQATKLSKEKIEKISKE